MDSIFAAQEWLGNLILAAREWLSGNASVLAGFSTASVLLMTAVIALVQYWSSQRWKRRQLAAEMIQNFHKDEDIALAILFLDVLEGDFPVPAKYVGMPGLDSTFHHSAERMKNAFDMHNRIFDPHAGGSYLHPRFRTEGLGLYVRVFDQMFERIELLYSFVELRLIRANDIKPLRYWLAKIHHAKYDGVQVFDRYLRHYEYNGVLRLTKKLGKKRPHAQLPFKHMQAEDENLHPVANQ